MAEIAVRGGVVSYDIFAPRDDQLLVVTPGGRFGRDDEGLMGLGERLAAAGKRVLLWDRPNCGASDVQFVGQTESHMRADVLADLIGILELGPVVALGGSGGARDAIVFALEYPDLVTKLAVWWIVGGTYSTINLAATYVLSELKAVRAGGMEAVARLPSWAHLLEVNPRNRTRLLSLDPTQFEATMLRWLDAFVPKSTETVPGVPDARLREIGVPTMVIRSGMGDVDHPRRTSLEVHAMIATSALVDPPWPEDAWERDVVASLDQRASLFQAWPIAAPLLLDFIEGRGLAGARLPGMTSS